MLLCIMFSAAARHCQRRYPSHIVIDCESVTASSTSMFTRVQQGFTLRWCTYRRGAIVTFAVLNNNNNNNN